MSAARDGSRTRPGGGDAQASARGDRLCVTVQGRRFEIQAACPHKGAPLADGELVGPFLRCAWHGALFDVRDGHVLRGPPCPPLEVRERVPDERRRGTEPA